jgi:hypothetical protein
MAAQQTSPPLRTVPEMVAVLEKTIVAVQPYGFLADTVMQPLSQLRDDLKHELDAAKVTTGTAVPTPAVQPTSSPAPVAVEPPQQPGKTG